MTVQVEAVLSLPLHALPPPSQLAPTLVSSFSCYILIICTRPYYLIYCTYLLPTCTPQVRARLLSLPRERVKGGIGAQSTWSHTTFSAQDAKHLQRLEAAFSQKESPELSVKTFCNLFKRL